MSKFGWSYPPGCHSVPGDEPEPPCEICGKFPEDCVCPECPRCGEIGDPDCYREVDLGICGELYEKETWAQKIGKQEFLVSDLYQQYQEASYILDWMKELAEQEAEQELRKKGLRKEETEDG